MALHHQISPPIKAVICDAYGTLFDVHSAIVAHAEAVGPQAQALSDLWRAKQLEYTWVLSLAGQWKNFWELTGQALDFALAKHPSIDPALRTPLLQAYRTLAAYPETASALVRLRSAGFRTGILSNGETSMLADAVASARLAPLLDAVWSVDQVKIFKPNPKVYAMAADGLSLHPHQICLVSSNRWDIAGAIAFGMAAVWVNRTSQPQEYMDLPPAFIVRDLNGLC
ncbi:MAG: haloacid dehalogenase type II [Beijerinckiaceae bacterium]